MKYLLPLLLVFSLLAWEKSLDLSYNLSFNNYSDNWVGGDASGINWTANADFVAERAWTDWLNSKNTAKLSFGHTHIQDNETKRWHRPIKSNDLIDLESVERFTLGKFVDPFISVRFVSQFIDANDVIVNPIDLSQSVGVARVFLKDEETRTELMSRLGGAFRQKITREVPDGLGNKETVSTLDGGIEMVTEYRTPILDGAVRFNSKLILYKALFYSEEHTAPDDAWKTPEVNWNTNFTAKLSDVVSVRLNIQLLFDEEVSKKFRHKEIMSVGLIYSPF